MLEKTNNSGPLNRFNKKCQVNINYERGVLLQVLLTKRPKSKAKSLLRKELENSAEEIRQKILKKGYKESGIKENSEILEDDLTIIGIGK